MISDWGEVVTRYPYGNVRMDHLLSKEKRRIFSIYLVVFLDTNRCVCSSAWLEHTPDKREVGGSSPLKRTIKDGDIAQLGERRTCTA